MKIAKLKSFNEFELIDKKKPEPDQGELLVKIKAGGICGTDIHIFSREKASEIFDHPLGHELSGEIVKNNSDFSHLKIGDRVIIENATNCGRCKYCKNGKPEFCSNIYNLENTRDFFERRGIELDRVLITAPPYTLKDAVSITRFGGIITYIGFAFNGKENITLDFNEIHLKKLQIRATHAIPNRFFPQALAYIKDGVITGDDFISNIFKFDEIQEAFEYSVREDIIKTVILFD